MVRVEGGDSDDRRLIFRRRRSGVGGVYRLMSGVFRGQSGCFGRRHLQKTVVVTHRKKTVLLLVGEIDQFAKRGDGLLGLGIGFFGGLMRQIMLAVAELNDLHEPARGLIAVPMGAHLLVNVEILAAKAQKGLAESAQQACVLDSLISWDDVTGRLQQHFGSLNPIVG